MRPEDMNASELLELDPEGGIIRFAGQRALLLDAVALGLLRKYLAESFGLDATRVALTQFGFAHGWRMAEAVRTRFPWDSPSHWRVAGARLYGLEGLFSVTVLGADPLDEAGTVLSESYEAEQHRAHFGPSETPVCWTIAGLMSGYLSKTEGEEIVVLEDRCVGRGDDHCHLVARSREQWESDAEGYSRDQLDASLAVPLAEVVETLEHAEHQLRSRPESADVATVEVAPEGLSARSPSMQRLIELAERVADVDATLLISGESGVGKELIARFIHDQSHRSEGPFVAVNCGAVTETLLESELFGHAKGAFTGAGQARQGLFEAASGGTLLLDEIGDVSPGMQSKLLRVLQEQEVRRVGENHNRPTDVRVIAATNKDLAELVAEDSFRQDLYYRLNVIELAVPPLRDRREDVLPLARVLLAEAADRMHRKITGFTAAVADQLLRCEWPGNVRELENAMERAVALATGSRVELEDLPDEVRQTEPRLLKSDEDVQTLEEVTREYILAALEVNDGNQAKTARQLGIGSATLYRKLKKYEAARLARTAPRA